MPSFTDKWILRNEEISSPKGRKNISVFAALLGTVVNILLGASKALAGVLIGSVALVADGVNNFSDSISALIVLVSSKIAQKPRDKEHPFGHGRLEYLGGFAIGFFILLLAWEILKSSIEQIISPKAVSFSWLSVGVLGVSILVKIGLYLFYMHFGKKIQSLPLIATGKDALSDVFASSAVVISLFISHYFGINVDGYIGLLVVAFIGKSGLDVCIETGDRLIGGKQDPDLREDISALLLEQPGIIGIHDLHIHDYGPGRSYATVDAEVDAKDSVVNIHRQIDQAERLVEESLNLSLSIHMDPVDESDPKMVEVKELVEKYLKGVHQELTLHDFQYVSIGKQVDLYFDVVVPESCSKKVEELKKGIEKYIQSLSPKYRSIVDFDIEMEG